jgi:hypothetical protein
MKFYKTKAFIILGVHTFVTIIFSVPLMSLQMMMVMDKINKANNGVMNDIILYGGLSLPILFLLSLIACWIFFVIKQVKAAYISASIPWIILMILSVLNLLF